MATKRLSTPNRTVPSKYFRGTLFEETEAKQMVNEDSKAESDFEVEKEKDGDEESDDQEEEIDEDEEGLDGFVEVKKLLEICDGPSDSIGRVDNWVSFSIKLH